MTDIHQQYLNIWRICEIENIFIIFIFYENILILFAFTKRDA